MVNVVETSLDPVGTCGNIVGTFEGTWMGPMGTCGNFVRTSWEIVGTSWELRGNFVRTGRVPWERSRELENLWEILGEPNENFVGISRELEGFHGTTCGKN